MDRIRADCSHDSFTTGEWEGLDRCALEHGLGWTDYLLADFYAAEYPRYVLEKGAPGNLPLLGFPEISMYGAVPWGGFGANPLPGMEQRLWDRVRTVQVGGFPYSEGIFEDINKAI